MLLSTCIQLCSFNKVDPPLILNFLKLLLEVREYKMKHSFLFRKKMAEESGPDGLISSSPAVLEFPLCFHQTSLCSSLRRTQWLAQMFTECQYWVSSKSISEDESVGCLHLQALTEVLQGSLLSLHLVGNCKPWTFFCEPLSSWFGFKVKFEFAANGVMIRVIFCTGHHSGMHIFQVSLNHWSIHDIFQVSLNHCGMHFIFQVSLNHCGMHFIFQVSLNHCGMVCIISFRSH